MRPPSSVTASRQLKESYIEISKFFRRSHHTQTRIHEFGGSESSLRFEHGARPKKLHCAVTVQCKRDRRVRPFSTGVKRPNTQETIARFQRSSIDTHTPQDGWETLSGCTGSDSQTYRLYGYVTSHRIGRKVDFFTIVDPTLSRAIQIVCDKQVVAKAQELEENKNKPFQPHSPVVVVGKVVKTAKLPSGMSPGQTTFSVTDQFVGQVDRIGHLEVQAQYISALNSFPELVVAKNDTNFAPDKRHLQFRTDDRLRHAIQKRSKIKQACSNFLVEDGFTDVETPLLFKSTPEGAREFVVPTRRKNLAYALPQSPQQYKQILMASGVTRYFQFARCFRDEDMRADRQPEFTQLDLEMSFANSWSVMSLVERLILRAVWPMVEPASRLSSSLPNGKPTGPLNLILPVMKYQDAMAKYGSDKPDPRLGAEIVRVDHWLPDSLKRMLTDLQDPIVEMIKISSKDQDPTKTKGFLTSFMDLPSSVQYVKNAQGMAGICVYDPMKPLRGLATFGHEAADQVEELFEPDEGDILVAVCRPNRSFSGGSTNLGNLRRDLLSYAVAQDLIAPPTHDSLLWMTDFPLFSPIEEDAPGQGGAAGICSTHHPFTAPQNNQDLSQLLTDPLSIIGDHYDLVINGVEVGGGSRRIHDAQMQELIFRDVLKMQPESIEHFRHLLNALDAGCPPHAGFALGFDRLMALLLNKTSVRDVIAFPKYGDGDDKLVGSPSPLTATQLSTYHLKVSDEVVSEAEPRVSIKA